MPVEVYPFQVTIPAGTLPTAPYVEAITTPIRIVRRIVIRIPPGPSGFMGFMITANNSPVIPPRAGTWMVMDDQELPIDVVNLIESGAFQVTGYNTGIYDHTVYLWFEVDLPPDKDVVQRSQPLALPVGFGQDGGAP